MPLDSLQRFQIDDLLDIHYGPGASKEALFDHIKAYEKAVPPVLSELDRLTAELATAQAERDRLQAMVPRLEWGTGTYGGWHLNAYTFGCDVMIGRVTPTGPGQWSGVYRESTGPNAGKLLGRYVDSPSSARLVIIAALPPEWRALVPALPEGAW